MGTLKSAFIWWKERHARSSAMKYPVVPTTMFANVHPASTVTAVQFIEMRCEFSSTR